MLKGGVIDRMDTEKMFLTDDGFNLVCEGLAEEDLKTARHFIEITRHMQEIHQLFLIFKKDIDNLQSEYVLKNNGNVFCDERPASSGADYISVNSHIINIISAGRTLVESMECYIKNNSGIGDEKQKYLEFYHGIFVFRTGLTICLSLKMQLQTAKITLWRIIISAVCITIKSVMMMRFPVGRTR